MQRLNQRAKLNETSLVSVRKKFIGNIPQAMIQDNSPAQETQGGKTSKILIWGLAGCGCLGFGVILLSILAAIALPSFLNQANKAREAEGKTYVGSLNRSQQAHFLEKEAFSDSIEALGLGIPAQTETYSYQVGVQPSQPPVAIALATPVQENIKGYVGFVFLTPEAESDSFISSAILCETIAPVSAASPLPSPTPTAFMECPAGFVVLD